MKYIQAVILAAIAISSAANKGLEPVASPTAVIEGELDENHRKLPHKTKAPTVPKTKAPVVVPTPDLPTIFPTYDHDHEHSMSFSISSKTSKVDTKAGKQSSSVSMSVESKAAKSRRNLR